VPTLIDNVLTIVGGIAAQRASNIQMIVESIYTPLFAAFDDVSDSIDDNLQNLENIQDNTAAIVADLMTLDTTLTQIDTDNSNNGVTCNNIATTLSPGNQAAFLSICNSYTAFSAVSILIDYSAFPDLSSYVTDLTAIQTANIDQYKLDAMMVVDDLFVTIQDTITDAQNDLQTELDNFHAEVSTDFHTAVNEASADFDDNFDAAQWNKDIDVRVAVCLCFAHFFPGFV
jgi:hypothetical protein